MPITPQQINQIRNVGTSGSLGSTGVLNPNSGQGIVSNITRGQPVRSTPVPRQSSTLSRGTPISSSATLNSLRSGTQTFGASSPGPSANYVPNMAGGGPEMYSFGGAGTNLSASNTTSTEPVYTPPPKPVLSGQAQRYQEMSLGSLMQPGMDTSNSGLTADSYKGRAGVSTSLYTKSAPRGSSDIDVTNSTGQRPSKAGGSVKDSLVNTINTTKTKKEAQQTALQSTIVGLEKQAEDVAAYNPEDVQAISDLNAQIASINKMLEDSQQLTPEEQATQQQLDALLSAEGQVNAGLNQKITDVNAEPISSKLLEGWGTTFNKDANAKLQTIGANKLPLQLQLSRLQSKRQAATDVSKTKLGSLRDERGYKTDIYGEQYKRKTKLADEKSDRAYKDSQRNASDIYGSGMIGEYEYAKNANGYKGTFNQYQNEDVNRKYRASGGGRGSGSPKSTEGERQQSYQSVTVQKIKQLEGGDGYLAPKDYRNIKEIWVSDGRDASEFDRLYGYKVNPKATKEVFGK